jgi:hypothetical protein
MTGLESDFLRACAELVAAQRELLPLLADTLGVAPEEIFYSWMERSFPGVVVPPDEEWRLQLGQIRDTDWQYFFHGLECDLHNVEDGRHVRVEFGPCGRIDALTSYAVLQYVMTSRAPWSELQQLKEYLAEKPPPYDSDSGSYEKACELWKRLEALGLLAPADPELCALVEAGKSFQQGRGWVVNLPDDLTERQQIDTMVCRRRVLSPTAWELLGVPRPD